MTDRPAIKRRLTDDERDLLAELLAQGIAEQCRITTKAAADQLADLADKGQIVMRGDDLDVYIDVCGKTLLHVERDWLAFYAHNQNEPIDLDKHRVWKPTRDLTTEANRRLGEGEK